MWAPPAPAAAGQPRKPCPPPRTGPHQAPCPLPPAQSQHMTRLNDISLMRERPGTRGHLEPWSPLLGPPQGGTALATPGHRGRWASGHESDDYELLGHGLVSPRSLCPHSTRTPRWFTGRSLSGRPHHPAPARPAQSLYHTSRDAHRVSRHRKDKGTGPRTVSLIAAPPKPSTAGSSSALHFQHE